MSKQAFDRKLEAIEALRAAAAEEAVSQLRKALTDRNNYVVGKAAAVVEARQFRELIPELAAAFDRFLKDAAKADPQCWAKNAIARALAHLEYDEPELFLKGLAHVQMEPVWGGREDSAATLRSTCALALTGCRLETFSVLVYLTGALNDAQPGVRCDAARAIAHLGAREGVLPLRLKALAGDLEAQVTGECFAALLTLDPRESLGFVAGFLDHADTSVRIEAAAALAVSPEPRALEAVEEFYGRLAEAETKGTILRVLAGSPLPRAAEFLFSVLEQSSGRVAAAALEALESGRFREQFRTRIEARRHPSPDR